MQGRGEQKERRREGRGKNTKKAGRQKEKKGAARKEMFGGRKHVAFTVHISNAQSVVGYVMDKCLCTIV